ncbi:DNA polymerase delta subunit 2, partial [Stegodyphus mimosarum]
MVSKTNGNVLRSHSGDIAVHVRPISKYTNLCHKYLIQERTFDRQYASFYISRLRVTISRLHEQAKRKWGSDIPIKQLCDISGNESCIIIGTLYKHMELHPSILKEISEEHNLIPQPVTEEFTNDDDVLILEDNLQRVILCGNIDPHSHVTGINIAIYGYTEEG